MKAKKALIRKSAFLSLSGSLLSEQVVTLEVAHQMVTEDMIHKALMTHPILKAPGPNKFNFRILRIVWRWDSKRFITMV